MPDIAASTSRNPHDRSGRGGSRLLRGAVAVAGAAVLVLPVFAGPASAAAVPVSHSAAATRPFWLAAGQSSEPGAASGASALAATAYPQTTPAQTVARAQIWLTAGPGGQRVPYSMERCFPSGVATTGTCTVPDYRTDCSGYVSMALGLPSSLNTVAMASPTFSTPITKADLRQGDLMLNSATGGDGHVLIFDHWTDSSDSSYYGYEQSGDGGTHYRPIPYPYFGTYVMSPVRYVGMSGGLHSISVGDLNNDGKNDLVGLKANGDVYFQPNTGAGSGITWGTGFTAITRSGYTQIAVGDLNNDGRVDLVGRRPNGDIVLLPNLGGGSGITWGTSITVFSQSGYDYFSVGDLNNDGKTDLIGRKANGDLYLNPNTGAGNGVTWGTGWTVVGQSGADTFDVGDLNNDGHVDLTYRQTSTTDINFLSNSGAGSGVTWATGWTVISPSAY